MKEDTQMGVGPVQLIPLERKRNKGEEGYRRRRPQTWPATSP